MVGRNLDSLSAAGPLKSLTTLRFALKKNPLVFLLLLLLLLFDRETSLSECYMGYFTSLESAPYHSLPMFLILS